MKPNRASSGYTIIETMIFLTVSSLIFASVVGAMSMQNRRNQFTESVNTFNQKLQDIMNDVDTGYFPTNGDFTCFASASGPKNDPGPGSEQGKHDGCIFLGKSIAKNSSNGAKFDVRTLVGNRTIGGAMDGKDVSSLSEANVSEWDGVFASDSGELSAGVQITKIRTAGTDVDKMGVLTGFGTANASGEGFKSGAIKSQLATKTGSNAWQPASNGVVICLAEDGDATNGRKATIKIGVGSSQTTSVVNIDNYDGC